MPITLQILFYLCSRLVWADALPCSVRAVLSVFARLLFLTSWHLNNYVVKLALHYTIVIIIANKVSRSVDWLWRTHHLCKVLALALLFNRGLVQHKLLRHRMSRLRHFLLLRVIVVHGRWTSPTSSNCLLFTSQFCSGCLNWLKQVLVWSQI